VRESDRIARTYAQATAPREIVDRPRDDPETHAIELAKQRRDLPRQRAVDERLQENGLGAVLTLVHGDELPENGIGAFAAGSPTLDAADQSFRPSAERRVHETFLRRRMEIDSPRRNVRAPRHLAEPHRFVSPPRDLTQGGGLDRG
jgi:hypothetical protein